MAKTSRLAKASRITAIVGACCFLAAVLVPVASVATIVWVLRD